MFVQVIQGQVADREAVERQFERWDQELRPGAPGYLGSTGGVADDGRLIMFARFESADAARANSSRSEQGAWWSETEKALEGSATFADSEDVETFLAGGSDEAGFVQFMIGTGVDRPRLRDADAAFERLAPRRRPDLIGTIRVWTGKDSYIEAAYFTSEEDARKGEAEAIEGEVAEAMAAFRAAVPDIEFVDIKKPMLM